MPVTDPNYCLARPNGLEKPRRLHFEALGFGETPRAARAR
jgi:hypothetical protein